MLQKEISEIDSSEKALKEFGIVLGMLFGLVAAWRAWHFQQLPIICITIAIVFIVFALFGPAKLKTMQRIWMTLALLTGWVMTRVILCLVFYLVLTPIAWLGKIFGQKFLGSHRHRPAKSYWIQSNITRSNLEEYKQQF